MPEPQPCTELPADRLNEEMTLLLGSCLPFQQVSWAVTRISLEVKFKIEAPGIILDDVTNTLPEDYKSLRAMITNFRSVRYGEPASSRMVESRSDWFVRKNERENPGPTSEDIDHYLCLQNEDALDEAAINLQEVLDDVEHGRPVSPKDLTIVHHLLEAADPSRR